MAGSDINSWDRNLLEDSSLTGLTVELGQPTKLASAGTDNKSGLHMASLDGLGFLRVWHLQVKTIFMAVQAL